MVCTFATPRLPVLELQVSVAHAVPMEISQGPEHLPYGHDGLVLGEDAPIVPAVVELAASAEFHDEVATAFVEIHVQELHDAWVVQLPHMKEAEIGFLKELKGSTNCKQSFRWRCAS